MQNGFIERFNRSYRQAVLDMFVFQTLIWRQHDVCKSLEITRYAAADLELGR